MRILNGDIETFVSIAMYRAKEQLYLIHKILAYISNRAS